MESDFLRDYGIELGKEFKTMSWRKFIALFSGLSKDSAFFAVILNKKDEPIIEDDPEIMAALFREAFMG